jgi:hypothetical protein
MVSPDGLHIIAESAFKEIAGGNPDLNHGKRALLSVQAAQAVVALTTTAPNGSPVAAYVDPFLVKL